MKATATPRVRTRKNGSDDTSVGKLRVHLAAIVGRGQGAFRFGGGIGEGDTPVRREERECPEVGFDCRIFRG